MQRIVPGTTSSYRARTEFLFGVRVTYGDFRAALELLDERDRGDAKLTNRPALARNAAQRADVLLEGGEDDAARSLVRTFLRRSAAYTPWAEDDTVEVMWRAVRLGVETSTNLVEVAQRGLGEIPTGPLQSVATGLHLHKNQGLARDAVTARPSPTALEELRVRLVPLKVTGIPLGRRNHVRARRSCGPRPPMAP